MQDSVTALIGMAVLAALALAGFAVYRWRQRERARRVDRWVRDYLAARYGGVPDGLRIDCSDDQLWPVLVSFDGRPGEPRQRLRFSCAGPTSSFALLSEEGAG